VPANQYLNFRGSKASTSRGSAPFLPLYLDRYDADTIRFYLAAIMPETGDSEFSELDLIRRNNEELLSTWGNLANRVLTFAYRNFEQRVPDHGELTDADRSLVEQGDVMLEDVGRSIAACRFREGLQRALAYAQEANRYLNQQAPWQSIKADHAAAGRAVYSALAAIEALKVGLYPYVPFSSQRLHAMLGHTGRAEDGGWKAERPQPGAALREPAPLFRKLEAPE